MKKILALTTLTNTVALKEAVDGIRREYGTILALRKIYFDDYHDPDVSIASVEEGLQWADIILVDIRADVRIARELPGRIRMLNDKTVVVLVGAGLHILSLTRMGSFSSEILFAKAKEKEFSVHAYIKAKKYSELSKKIGGLLPFGMLKHMRNWILAQEYYQEGDSSNIKNLILMLLKEYGGITGIKKVPLPQHGLPYGLYVPDEGFYDNLDAYKRKINFDPEKPSVGILFYGGMHFNDTRPAADALYACLHGEVNIVNVFSNVEYNIEAIKKYLSGIDLFLNLQYFRIHGGPYGGEPEPTYAFLQKLDVPCLIGLRAYETEITTWEKESHGLHPLETVLGVVLPELDGAIEPLFIAGVESHDDVEFGKVKKISVLPDRVEKLCARIKNWLALRKKPHKDKRVAIITYNYPPGEEATASAGYLDVFESLKVFFDKLSRSGYTLTVPEGNLKDFFLSSGLVNSPRYIQKQGIRVSSELYRSWFNTLPAHIQREVIKHWGEPPGTIMIDGDQIVLPGVTLGNVFLGIQPARGVHEDPDKAYHDKGLPPHHQYLAYYLYLQNVFQADALVHFGMHGTLEFTKGKEIALSSACYPDMLIGSMPHIYYYWIGNTSEATIAKRRSYALCISHASPPMRTSGLYEQYIVLDDLLHEYAENPREETEAVIRRLAVEMHLPDNVPGLGKELYKIKRRLIPYGLHVLGRTFTADEAVGYLLGVLRIDREFPSVLKLAAQHSALPFEALPPRMLDEIEQQAQDIVRNILDGEAPSWLPPGYAAFVEKIFERLSGALEPENLLRALDGRYIFPFRGGDPIRDPDIYPSGRGMYAFDPRAIPTIAAEIRGGKAADLILDTYRQSHGTYPESVGIVLWGFETMKTGGDTIGTILSLLGLRIKHSKNVWFKELEVIPLKELQRPRIDAVITMCGIFRDTFGTHIDLLNRAVETVAALEEPPESNFIRKHFCAHQEALQDFALARIFGPARTEYATSMRTMVETGAWNNEDELVKSYDDSMSYAYFKGKAVKHEEAFAGLVKTIDIVTQERDNTEYEVTDLDHYYEFLGGLSRTVQHKKGDKADVLVVDSTEEDVSVEKLAVVIERATRTRILNPSWLEGMLRHDFHGAQKVKDRVEHLLGFASTTGEVQNWIFDGVADRLIFDDEMRKRLQANNPYATVKICESLMETSQRGYWDAGEERLKKLRNLLFTMEGTIE